MFIIKNNTKAPLFIGDLNCKLDPYSKIDLETKFSREHFEQSNDLKRLVQQKYLLVLINKKSSFQRLPKVKPVQGDFETSEKDASSNSVNNEILSKMMEMMGEMRDMMANGSQIQSKKREYEYEYEDDTKQRVADLQAKALSKQDIYVDKNFESIGNESVGSKEDVSDLLNILNELENKGD